MRSERLQCPPAAAVSASCPLPRSRAGPPRAAKLSTAPAEPRTHWHQTLFFLPERRAGSAVDVTFALEAEESAGETAPVWESGLSGVARFVSLGISVCRVFWYVASGFQFVLWLVC